MGCAPITAFREVARLRGSKCPVKYHVDSEYQQQFGDFVFLGMRDHILDSFCSKSNVKQSDNSNSFAQKVINLLSGLFKK